MSVPQVKLTYNATLMRIKVELLRSQCMTSELPPADLVSRARHALQNSFEQISFEIEEWSTDKQIELQQLSEDIGKYLHT